MSIDARAFSCPGCGAKVDEHARRCVYCGAAVATLRCGVCFHMNAADAAHCSGCGHDLGLEPIGELGTLHCPRDGERLTLFGEDGSRLHDCGKCGGQFVDHELLKSLLARHESITLSTRSKRAPAVAPNDVKYLPCPVCKVLMNRKNFGMVSGVIVDVCKQHGTWFDLGELPRVLAFVEDGGLARTKQRELEQHAEELQRARAAQLQTELSHEMNSSRDAVHLERVKSIASVIWDILVH